MDRNPWHRVDDVAGRLALWLYGPRKRSLREIRSLARRLEALLAEVASDKEAILGHEARALIAEARGDTETAKVHRMKEKEQIEKSLATGFCDHRHYPGVVLRLQRHIEWLSGLDSGYPLEVTRGIIGR